MAKTKVEEVTGQGRIKDNSDIEGICIIIKFVFKRDGWFVIHFSSRGVFRQQSYFALMYSHHQLHIS
jgi:hypothetical protein